MILMWSSSLTQTRKFLSSLCQIPLASGQSRAILDVQEIRRLRCTENGLWHLASHAPFWVYRKLGDYDVQRMASGIWPVTRHSGCTGNLEITMYREWRCLTKNTMAQELTKASGLEFISIFDHRRN